MRLATVIAVTVTGATPAITIGDDADPATAMPVSAWALAVPPTHAANTRPNQLHKRKLAVLRFFAHPALDVARRWRAEWIVFTRAERLQALERRGLRPVYQDRTFVVFPVPLVFVQ